jgi:hypothetical protein
MAGRSRLVNSFPCLIRLCPLHSIFFSSDVVDKSPPPLLLSVYNREGDQEGDETFLGCAEVKPRLVHGAIDDSWIKSVFPLPLCSRVSRKLNDWSPIGSHPEERRESLAKSTSRSGTKS